MHLHWSSMHWGNYKSKDNPTIQCRHFLSSSSGIRKSSAFTTFALFLNPPQMFGSETTYSSSPVDPEQFQLSRWQNNRACGTSHCVVHLFFTFLAHFLSPLQFLDGCIHGEQKSDQHLGPVKLCLIGKFPLVLFFDHSRLYWGQTPECD